MATASGTRCVELTPTLPLKKKTVAWAAELPCFESLELQALISDIEEFFAAVFCSGDVATARLDLLVKVERPTNWLDFEAGLRIGCVGLLLVWALWDCLVDSTIQASSASRQISASIPVYRGCGCLILLVWCWGLDIYVWTRARVNYLFIFDSDHANTMGHNEVWSFESTSACVAKAGGACTQVWREASVLTIFFLVNFLVRCVLATGLAGVHVFV